MILDFHGSSTLVYRGLALFYFLDTRLLLIIGFLTLLIRTLLLTVLVTSKIQVRDFHRILFYCPPISS